MLISTGLLTAPHGLAATYAYIPSIDAGLVIRIEDDETNTEFSFSSVTISGGPYGAAVTPDGSYAVVTVTNADILYKIPNSYFDESGSVVAIELPSGSTPRGVAIESEGLYAYVANHGNDNVTKINLTTNNTIGDSITVGDGPWGLAAIYDEADDVRKVYVANHFSDTITVIVDDGSDETNETVNLDNDGLDNTTGPIGVALTPDGQYLYVANNMANTVSIIQTGNNTVVQTLNVGKGPWGVAVGSDGDYVYVTNNLDGTVTVIDAEDQKVDGSAIDVGDQPTGVASPRNGDFVYVVNQGDVNDSDKDPSISKFDVDIRSNVVTIADDDFDLENAQALGAFIGGTPPSRPTGLNAEAESYNRIALTWTDNSSDELGFKIERRMNGDDAFIQIDKVDADETTYSDDDLEKDTTYDYRVRSYNEAADSDFSATATATTDEDQFTWCFVNVLRQ